MFKFDWSQIDAKTGLIFMVGVLLVFNVMGVDWRRLPGPSIDVV